MIKRSHEFSYFPYDIMSRYRELRAAYGERDSDIYVSTYTRSGTTWMQMILYQLTTDGNMDFDHIYDVSPWFYYSARWSIIPTCSPDPRILKTHDYYNFYDANTKGKFVYVIRDGKDVIVSFYHHKINVKGYTGTFEEHFDECVNADYYNCVNGDYYNWFEHVKGWLENKNNFPILYVKYESLKNDFDNEVKRIIDFCDIPVNDSILKRTKERTNFTFMKKCSSQLGPPRKPKSHHQFIRKGLIGEGSQRLTNKQKDMFSKKFHETLGHLDLVSEYGE
jgi:hypothetical protein